MSDCMTIISYYRDTSVARVHHFLCASFAKNLSENFCGETTDFYVTQTLNTNI